MREGTTGGVQARSLRLRVVTCLGLILAMVPFASRAEEALNHFEIKAQPLSEALMAFGAQTGAIVMAPSELTAGKTSRPVTGQLSAQEALTRMLLGTGLKFQKTANGTILIVREFAHTP
jgi:iron complex outermembrane recepter protein